jgi:monovalent cation/proton antiporter MnhG/PhaG subunit
MSPLMAIRDALVVVLGAAGGFFFLAGTLGMLRFPDFYSRTHAATKCDSVGAGSILLGLAVLRGFEPDMPKLLLLAGLVVLSSPTAVHALARAAYRTGLEPRLRAGEPQ